MKKIIFLLIGCFIMSSALANDNTPPNGTPLTGTQTKELITNRMFAFTHSAEHNQSKHIYYGTTYTIFMVFLNDGSLIGMSTVPLPGVANKDKGKWWMEGDKQCGLWDNWIDHKPFCTQWYDMKNEYVVVFTTNKLSGIISKDRII